MPEPATFIGKLGADGQPVNLAAFGNYFGHDAEVFLWSSGTLHRDFLKALGRYAFGDMQCKRITCRVAGDNPWRHTLTRLGFVHEGTMRGGYDGDIDLLIFGILRDEYRYGRQEST